MTAFKKLNLTQIVPKGWLRDQLEIQMKGLSGQLYYKWDSVGSYSGWLGGTGDGWERVPYYLDGLIPLSYYLGDREHMEICQKFLTWTLNSQTQDGNFGPVVTKNDYWSRYCMLKVLLLYHEICQDPRILEFACRYFRYVLQEFPRRPPENWSKARIPELLLCMKYVYEQTKQEWIVEAARKIDSYSLDWVSFMEVLPFPRPSGYYMNWDSIKDYNHSRLDEIVPFHATHIVNVTMGLKHPAMRAFFGEKLDAREINRKGLEQLDRFHGTPSGCINGDEHLSGRDPRQGAELCSVAECMFSLAVMLEQSGDPQMADRLERLAYNALPATITEDFMAHQYLQQANQVQVDVRKRPWYNNRDDASIFGLEPNFGCCTANMHQAWPKFVNALWYRRDENTLVSSVFAPSEVCTQLGDGSVKIELETAYPFRDRLVYHIHQNTCKQLTLLLRVPQWCHGAAVKYNGEPRKYPLEDGFLRVEESFRPGDTLEMVLPMEITYSNWYENSLAVERGPLVYGLDIKERFQQVREVCGFKDYHVYAESPWNYALRKGAEGKWEERPLTGVPFSHSGAPCAIYLPGKLVPQWELQDGNTSDLPAERSFEGAEQMVRLIPYGCTKLRISEFPWYEEEQKQQEERI